MLSNPALADDEVRCALSAMDADVKAALAFSRATLRVLATLSPLLQTATEEALEDEIDRVREAAAAHPRTLKTVEDLQAKIQRAPAEARKARAMHRALLNAAEGLGASDRGHEARANAA